MSHTNLLFDQSLNMVFKATANNEVHLGYPLPDQLLIDFFMIGGGGGGGKSFNFGSGGGGAGGYIYLTGQTIVQGSYNIVIGQGGVGTQPETNGDPTTFSGLTANGGGHGETPNVPGANGGCGGGAGCGVSGAVSGGIGSQGFNGGGSPNGAVLGGSGGGIGSAGQYNGAGNTPGGVGLTFSIFTGTTFGVGGTGNGNGANGTANTGNGGNGVNANANGGNGGSGIVIVRHLTSDSPSATGGNISTSGLYTIHTFTTNGTLTL